VIDASEPTSSTGFGFDRADVAIRTTSATKPTSAAATTRHDGTERGDRVEIDLAYFNYAHGGMANASSRGEKPPSGYDFTGLVRVMQERWPHVLVMGEGDYYEYFGGAGMWGAAEAMREAGGRAYMPLPCQLPREGGPFAPCVFFDAQTLIVKHWCCYRALFVSDECCFGRCNCE
jgi:hypothetical protein